MMFHFLCSSQKADYSPRSGLDFVFKNFEIQLILQLPCGCTIRWQGLTNSKQTSNSVTGKLNVKAFISFKPLATCPDPEEPYNGFRLDSVEEFIPGTEVSYGCEVKTKLIGSNKRKCLPSGMWTGEQPRCQGESK